MGRMAARRASLQTEAGLRTGGRARLLLEAGTGAGRGRGEADPVGKMALRVLRNAVRGAAALPRL